MIHRLYAKQGGNFYNYTNLSYDSIHDCINLIQDFWNSTMASNISKFDVVYRSLLLSNFFTKGWGKPEDLKNIFELRRKLGRRDLAKTYVDPNHPVVITLDKNKGDHRLLEGYFYTPFASYLPDLLPPESEKAYFQAILPAEQNRKGRLNPVCGENFIHFCDNVFQFNKFCSAICRNRRSFLLEA